MVRKEDDMSILEIAKIRHSVRKYLPQKVEQEKLLLVLKAGRVAPTGCNYQPQRLIVVQSEDGLNRLFKACINFGAPLAIIVCGDNNNVWHRQCDDKSILDIDVSIVTTQMMLQATELGLGSLWMCKFDPDIIRSEFNLPDNVVPINILWLGYEAGPPLSPDRHDTMRKPLDQTVFYETM